MTEAIKRKLFAKKMESNRIRLKCITAQEFSYSDDVNDGDGLASTMSPQVACSHESAILSFSFARLQPDNDVSGSGNHTSRHEEKDKDYAILNRNVRPRKRWGDRLSKTMSDPKITNNNRIITKRRNLHGKQWSHANLWAFAIFCFYLVLCNCLVQVSLVSAHPDTEPIRVSKPYTNTAKNGGNPAAKSFQPSTTLRSTASFLPSDAVTTLKQPSSPLLRSTVIKNKIRNINFSKNDRNSNENSRNITSLNHYPNHNANLYRSSSSAERLFSLSSSSRRRRKNKYVQTTTMSSIDRPFYTKLKSSDEVSKAPIVYGRNKLTTKQPKKSKYSSTHKYQHHRYPSSSSSSSSSSTGSSEKYSKTKSSKSSKSKSTKTKRKQKSKKQQREQYEYTDDNNMEIPEDIENEYAAAILPHTTEKSYHPPKLSLEPFFNFLTSLATASREVIMSKEQQHNEQQPLSATTELPESILESSAGYDDDVADEEDEDAINQSLREDVKKSQKSSRESKRKNRGNKKGSKENDGTGIRNKHKIKSSEESMDEEEYQQDQASEGPIPIPLPNKIIGSDEMEGNGDDNDNYETINDDDDATTNNESPPENSGLHILDILRTPMIADYESSTTTTTTPLPLPFPVPQIQLRPQLLRFTPSEADPSPMPNQEEIKLGRPPSGRANIKKGQGYATFENYQVSETNMANAAAANIQQQQQQQQQKGKQQRSERDPMDSFYDQSVTDLQAQESVSHSQMLLPPSSFSSSAATSSGSDDDLLNQQQQINEPSSMAAASSTSNSNAIQNDGKATAVKTDIFGQPLSNGKDDTVSQYPTTFVYQPTGQMPPGSRLYVSPSGMPPRFGTQPTSLSPFRVNKLRPNLHSYYDPSYHHYTGAGESQVASEMIGIRHPYGPPHFTSPPHHRILPSPPPPPPRFGNGYGNKPGFMMMPHRGNHYSGHSVVGGGSLHHKEPMTRPYESNDGQSGSANQGDLSGSDAIRGSPDTVDQYGSVTDENSIIAAENSETKKIGIMESFDLFYKEYKIMTWVAVFFVTSLALLTLLVYLYVNNPPTEVVQARQLFPWNDLLNNPQIMKFLSSLIPIRTNRSDDINPFLTPEAYFKHFGNGFGSKAARQRRKGTKSQQDSNKLARKIKQLNRRLIISPTTSSRPTLKLRPSARAKMAKTDPYSNSTVTVHRAAASFVTKQ